MTLETLLYTFAAITAIYHFSIYPTTQFAKFMERKTGSYDGALSVTFVLCFITFIFVLINFLTH